jgi:hypothetical protein
MLTALNSVTWVRPVLVIRLSFCVETVIKLDSEAHLFQEGEKKLICKRKKLRISGV